MKVRDASLEDVYSIIEIALESFWKEYGSWEEAEKSFKNYVRKRWENLIKRRAGIVLVAEDDDRVIGFLVFRWWFGWNGWLETIAVKKEYRGKGVGTQLIKALIEKAREEGYSKICFAVEDENLIKFYKKFNAKYFGKLPEDSTTLTLYYIPTR